MAATPPDDMAARARMFTEKHKRTGIITNQPGEYDPDRDHASTIVCERPECQKKARFWVQGETGEPAVYVSDVERRKAANV